MSEKALKRQLIECRRERDMFEMSMVDHRAEAEHQEQERAAAEARVRLAMQVLSRIPPDFRPIGKQGREALRLLRKSDTAAYDAALEQRAVEVLDAVEACVDGYSPDFDQWGEDTSEACHNVLDAIQNALGRARQEGLFHASKIMENRSSHNRLEAMSEELAGRYDEARVLKRCAEQLTELAIAIREGQQ